MSEKEELLQAVRERAEELGRPPYTTDIQNDPNSPALVRYYEYWDSWGDVLDDIGQEPEYNGNPTASREKLIDELKEIAEELGRPPTEQEMMELSNQGKAYSVGTYKKYFGGWNIAKIEAGLRPLRMSENIKGMTKPLTHVSQD